MVCREFTCYEHTRLKTIKEDTSTQMFILLVDINLNKTMTGATGNSF